ncbi:MAG: flagellar hook-associated protein FlgK [Colwellia sp.]|nr:flagellar hook-associated protein FlgK [Colwellia sp.]
MSVNLYQTGVSALLSAQQQLATTGHNIANVNTEGYNRQRAEQNAAPGIASGSNYVGSGTYIQDIVRIYDKFSYKEQLLNTSNLASADSIHLDLTQLNDIMAFSGQSIGSSVDLFYQAVNGIADNPSDLGLRNIALNQASVVSSDIRLLNENFDQIEKSINGEIEQIANKISEISIELAKINETILHSQNLTQAGQPNDLLDKRDQLVSQLGEFTRVTTIEDSFGVMTVMIGQGTTLVAGITPLTVRIEAGDPDPLKTELRLVGPNSTVALNGSVVGGSLAAKYEFRDQHLAQARTEINRLAMAVSETLNAAQADGLDLNAQQGANFFTDINAIATQQARVLSPSNNAGNLQARVNITDVSKVPTDEFEVRFDGTDYIMTNRTNNSSTNLGPPGSGTYATTYGFEFIEDSGAPATDDSYLIRPTENSAANMLMTLTDPAKIAASSAVEITPSTSNVSAGEVKITDMIDPIAAQIAMPMRIDVLESPIGVFNYTITDNLGATSAPIAYTPPSQTINLPPLPATAAFTIEITGSPSGIAPNAPEQFFIGDAFGIGNSSNAVAMGLTQEQGTINGGRETFSQSLAKTTSIIGSKASSAELVASTAQALYTQAYNRNQATSGVNLDEEAANLMKYQQAYQAASQIISIANTIFDTLLSATR